MLPSVTPLKKSTFPILPGLPTSCPDLAAGQMGNIDFTNDVISVFEKPLFNTPFQPDNFNKEKASLILDPIAALDLNQLHQSLIDHLARNFPDKKFVVRSPLYEGAVKIGWPARINKTNKSRELLTVPKNELGGEGMEITMSQFNTRLIKNNLPPSTVDVVTRLWIRGDDNGQLIVGFYFQLARLHYHYAANCL